MGRSWFDGQGEVGTYVFEGKARDAEFRACVFWTPSGQCAGRDVAETELSAAGMRGEDQSSAQEVRGSGVPDVR